MGKGALLTIWIVASLAWIAVIANLGLGSWPHLPMDMSPADPATKAALEGAIRGHVMRYALLGIVPPFPLFLLGRLLLWPR